MASNPDRTVPLITTLPASSSPRRIASPDADYFPALGPRTPARSASPTSPAIRSTARVPLLRTPPVEVQSLPRSRPRGETQGEALASSPHSSARISRTASPSDNLSATLSPSISSGGGSVYSSNAGHSTCSISSSEYLTPPQFQADCDKRPYRARRQSSDSLSMIRKPKRATTMPHGRTRRSRRRHRRGHKCHHGKGKGHGHVNEHWCRPGCHVAPTAPKGMKELCGGHVGRYRPAESTRGNTDTFGRLLPRLRSDPAPPVVSRRWSSVEIGAHQIHLASTLPRRSAASTPGRHISDTEYPACRDSRPYRSSTLNFGVIDHDIVRNIRERLTVRKVSANPVQAPSTITLRRASGASITGVSTVTELLTPTNGLATGGITPRQYPISQEDRETDAAYLITRKEIDSITELIEANLRRKYRPHNRVSAHPPATPPSPARSPRFTSRSIMVPKTPSPSEPEVTIDQAKSSSSRIPDDLDFLQVAHQVPKRPRELTSQKSNHEIIWELGGSPSSLSSMERKQSSSANSSPKEETTDTTPRQPNIKPMDSARRLDESSAFDPKNARASINDWSWRLPPAEIPLIVTSSDDDSHDLTPASEAPPAIKPKIPIRSVASAPDVPRSYAKSRARPPTRAVASSHEIEDVVSFPPLLPRKTTNDWYSPLPDITPPARSPGPQSLYDEGIDATGSISAETLTSEFRLMPLLPPPQPSIPLPSPDVEFDPSYDMRRKSLIKAHPNTPARIGPPSTIGSSIGASSGERRSSVRPGLQRVSTIDNIHKGKRTATWTRNRPPSICPPPKTPSPAEFDDDSDGSTRTVQSSKKVSQLAQRPVKSLQPDTGPPMPKADRSGIYEKITGTVKLVLGLDREGCEDECPPRHECDDCMMDPRSPSVDWIG